MYCIALSDVKDIHIATVPHLMGFFSLGTGEFSFSMAFKPSSSFGDLTQKKPLPSKTAVPKETITSQVSKGKPVQQTKGAPTTNKVRDF